MLRRRRMARYATETAPARRALGVLVSDPT